MALSLNSIISLLQQEFGLKLQAQAPTATFQFDALLRSSVDPMPLFVLEDFSNADEKAVKERCRKLESFIWNLYRAGNVNTVTAIFVTGERTASDLVAVSKRLSSIGRMFFIKRSSSREDLLKYLRPLIPPRLSDIETDNQELATVIGRSGDIMEEIAKTPVIGTWIRENRSTEELRDKVCNEFERLMKDLQNAIK